MSLYLIFIHMRLIEITMSINPISLNRMIFYKLIVGQSVNRHTY